MNRAAPDPSCDPRIVSRFTGCALLFLGAAVVWLETRWAERLALLIVLLAHIALLGYLYGVRSLYAIGPYASVAPATAAALYLMALAVLLARPGRGLIGVVA